MQIHDTHLTYCSNIHPGESWEDHFLELQNHLPAIKAAVLPDREMGVGLRLAHRAAVELAQPGVLNAFKNWLTSEELYVFTINGFPFGDFHNGRVKEQVHAPDWSTDERLQYSQKLFEILSELLPAGVDGGVSTSPLSYRFWKCQTHPSHREKCTQHMLEMADFLSQIENSRGQYMHLDIEPEPDGLLENFDEFIDWYINELLPLGEQYFADRYQASASQAHSIIKRHLCLCYDICHFALAYQNHPACMERLKAENIRIGKIQVSSALKSPTGKQNNSQSLAKLAEFDEPIYLHQVIVEKPDGSFIKFRDLPEFLSQAPDSPMKEWRSHFHVPIFLADYGELLSTQDDILKVIGLHQHHPLSTHLEIETYTWNVLPKNLQLPIRDSIIREMQWLLEELKK